MSFILATTRAPHRIHEVAALPIFAHATTVIIGLGVFLKQRVQLLEEHMLCLLNKRLYCLAFEPSHHLPILILLIYGMHYLLQEPVIEQVFISQQHLLSFTTIFDQCPRQFSAYGAQTFYEILKLHL